MSNGVVEIRGKQYQTVALRVQQFREKHPVESGWRIITNVHTINESVVVVRARIVDDKGITVATGTAEEKRDANQINRTSALENCETSAIGRALAAAGYGGEEFATANEVANAIHQQGQQQTKRSSTSRSEFNGVTKGAENGVKWSDAYRTFREQIEEVLPKLKGRPKVNFPSGKEVLAWCVQSKLAPSIAYIQEQASHENLEEMYFKWLEVATAQPETVPV